MVKNKTGLTPELESDNQLGSFIGVIGELGGTFDVCLNVIDDMSILQFDNIANHIVLSSATFAILLGRSWELGNFVPNTLVLQNNKINGMILGLVSDVVVI